MAMITTPRLDTLKGNINDTSLASITVLDYEGNLWTLQDPGTRYWFSLPYFQEELVLYLPHALYPVGLAGSGGYRMVYPPGMSLLEMLGAITTFYNQVLTPEEKEDAIDEGYGQWLPALYTNKPVTVGNLYFQDNIFEGLIPYRDGYTIRIGYKLRNPDMS